VQVGTLTDWAQVAAGAYNTLAIKTNGTLWGWGLNTGGQLGDGTVITRSSPVQIGALSNWAQVATGSQRVPSGIFSVAVKTDGTLWTWGQDSEGQLGKSTRGINTSSPVQIGALTNWAQVSAGNQFVLARKTDGTLWSWGLGSSGNLGDNTSFVSKSSPIQIGALTNWAQVSAGGLFSSENFSLAVKIDGTLWAWGNNTRGQIGDNTAITKSSPVQIGALTNWSKVQAGTINDSIRGGFSVAVKTDGTLWTWGFNPNGQIGDNTIITKSSPVQIGALTGWEKPNNMPGSSTAGALF
jgi:alpha-tubulin suppressor-like RCC1 family protein